MNKIEIRNKINSILTKGVSGSICIFFTPDKKFIVTGKGRDPREASQDEIKDLLTKYPEIKPEVFTIEQEKWDEETKQFVRLSEAILPELIKGRCLFTDFDGAHKWVPYIQHAASGKGIIVIKDVKEHKDSQGNSCCDAPGVLKILIP